MKHLFLAALALFVGASHAHAACRTEEFEGKRLTVCEANPSGQDIRLFLNNGEGEAIRTFSRLKTIAEAQGETLLFAFNAGMYHRDLSPVGLYIEKGEEKQQVSTKPGGGNFHMLPNGIFWIDGGKAGVSETAAFLESGLTPAYATQSGPMLVIEGALHPRFIPSSDSEKVRNGVGVRENGTVVFAISNDVINFESFGRWFRDVANTPNALYLDGSISSAYIPSLNRHDFLFPMGPIVGVVEKN